MEAVGPDLRQAARAHTIDHQVGARTPRWAMRASGTSATFAPESVKSKI